MSMLDRIRDSFKYLDKNGLKHLIEKIKLHDVHWTGTHAEYEAVKDTIPAYAILHFTDDYDEGGISKHYYLGTGVYDRPYLPRTITINTTGRHVLIVTPHMGSTPGSGSTPGYQSNYSPVVFDITEQLGQANTNLNGTFCGYDETTGVVTWDLIHFADVTQRTQDTLTLSTEGITSNFPWFHVHVI